jgi:hypothetical protein
MESNAGLQQWYRLTLALSGGLGGPLATRRSRRTRSHPPPRSASEGIGGARGLGNLVRPGSLPEPRGFPFPGACIGPTRGSVTSR